MTSPLFTKRRSTEVAVSVPLAVPKKQFEIANFIAPGSVFRGNMELINGLRVDGIVEGSIEARADCEVEVTVHVAPGGQVHGDVIADNVVIEGRVHGTVRARKHLIVPGFLSGSASYGESVEMTGTIEANVARLAHVASRDVSAEASLGPATSPDVTPRLTPSQAAQMPSNLAQSISADQPIPAPRMPENIPSHPDAPVTGGKEAFAHRPGAKIV